MVEDDDCPAVVRNLMHARQKWVRMTWILIREGSNAWTLVHIYLAVVHLVMFYGLETWVLTPRMKRVLGGFHHRLACRLKGRQPRKRRYIGWFYPPLEDAMMEAVL